MLDASEGEQVETAAGAPRLRGVVERPVEDHSLVMRVEEPAPGLMEILAFDFKGPILVFVRGYFYGDAGPEAAAREESVWRAWLAEKLPGADASAEHVVKTA